MPDTTSYEFGDVVLVKYYHTDSPSIEKRPAVVVSSNVHNRDDIDVVLMSITTKTKHEGRHGGIDIPEWREINLLAESTIKPVFFTYHKEQVLKTFGRLKVATRKKLMLEVAKVFGFKVALSST